MASALLRNLGCRGFLKNWSRRRYSWRFSWLYNKTFWLLVLNVVFSLVFYHLIGATSCLSYQSCGFFVNYECVPKSVKFFANSTAVMSGFWIAQASLCYVEYRLLKIFVDHSQKDFADAGKWATAMGIAAKITPWLISLLHYVWLIVNIIAVILVVAIGICSNRFNEDGVLAVKTCRLYFAKCCNDSMCTGNVPSAYVTSCNSMSFLSSHCFLANPRVVESQDEICNIVKSGCVRADDPSSQVGTKANFIPLRDGGSSTEFDGPSDISRALRVSRRHRDARYPLTEDDENNSTSVRLGQPAGGFEWTGRDAKQSRSGSRYGSPMTNRPTSTSPASAAPQLNLNIDRELQGSGGGDSGAVHHASDSVLMSSQLNRLAAKNACQDQSLESCFLHRYSKSDMYRWMTLWTLLSVLLFVATTVVFQLFKLNSPMDTYLFHAKDRDGTNFILSLLRIFTPWT